MGYSSRIMAESWESNMLFYAALADELQLPPSQLNVLVPEWTQKTVERIFATHLEDWPALLRSLRVVGDEVRDQTRASVQALEQKAVACRNRRRTRMKIIANDTSVATATGSLPARSRRWLLGAGAQRPTFRVKVDMVVLSFTVTDSKGRYINGLKPADFRILEDGIPQKVATFAEGNKPPLQVLDDGTTTAAGRRAGAIPRSGGIATDAFVGTNVFVLFDTSNYMYRGFVYASDAIADFVRGLDRADSVAVYTFSRNLSRAATLTRDRNDAICGLRKAVAGDDSALYNALLLTLRDAAKVPGPQGGDRVLQRSGQRQHGGARRRPRGGRRRRHSDLRHLHQRGQQGPDFAAASSAASPRAPAARPTSPRPGRSRWRRSSRSARIWATPTPSPTIRSRTRTRASARSPSRSRATSRKKYRVRARPGYRPSTGV